MKNRDREKVGAWQSLIRHGMKSRATYPWKRPAHLFPIGFKLVWRSPGHRNPTRITTLEVIKWWDVVTKGGAAAAALLVVRTEHEVVDDQLSTAIEEVLESHGLCSIGIVRLWVGGGEGIVHGDLDHGKSAARLGECVEGLGDFLLLSEEVKAGLEMVLWCCYLQRKTCLQPGLHGWSKFVQGHAWTNGVTAEAWEPRHSPQQ